MRAGRVPLLRGEDETREVVLAAPQGPRGQFTPFLPLSIFADAHFTEGHVIIAAVRR